jgi:DNA-binding MarR family transcriptional regulator
MKPLEDETNLEVSAEDCAALVADTIPLVMRTIRAEMRGHRTPDLSVPQFRALGFLRRHPGASLSDVADHVGLTLPSISNMINRLEARNLVTRRTRAGDRRHISLELTPLGQLTMQAARDATRTRVAALLVALSPEERAVISRAMHSLGQVFSSEPGIEDGSEG